MITGCGGSGGSGDDGNGGDNADGVRIDAFSITGTDDRAVNSGDGPAVIDANHNGGDFQASFEADAPGVFTGRVYVSADNRIDLGDDPFFTKQGCGTPGTRCADGTYTGMCEFRRDNFVGCGLDRGKNVRSADYGDDLTQYFANTNGLPGSYFLILEICAQVRNDANELVRQCQTRSVKTNFR